MDKKTISIIVIAAFSILSTWVWTSLFTTSATKRDENIHKILDQIDEDMGIASDTAHALAALPRIKVVMNRMNEQVARQEAYRDSLIAAENEAVNGQAPVLTEEEKIRAAHRKNFPDVERDDGNVAAYQPNNEPNP